MVDNVLARLAVEVDAKLAPLQGQPRQLKTALVGLNRALSGVAIGLPRYARLENDRKGRSNDITTEQNPLPICMWPKALMRGTLT